MNAAILLAAGSGRRMQGVAHDKVLTLIAGKPTLQYSIEAFIESGCVATLCIVVRDTKQQQTIEKAVQALKLKAIQVRYVQGGQERQNSVYNALSSLPSDCANVFIHDCARPLLQAKFIRKLDEVVSNDRAAVLAHPVNDTIKRIQCTDTLKSAELEDLDRSRLWAMETPQAFAYSDILEAYQYITDKGLSVTDDTAAAATICLHTTIVPNDTPNPKLTTAQDLAYIEWLIQQQKQKRHLATSTLER